MTYKNPPIFCRPIKSAEKIDRIYRSSVIDLTHRQYVKTSRSKEISVHSLTEPRQIPLTHTAACNHPTQFERSVFRPVITCDTWTRHASRSQGKT